MGTWTRRSSRSAAVAALACVPLTVLGPAASAQANPPLTWKAPVLVEHAPFAIGNVVTAVTCPSPGLCVAADNAGTILTSTDPASKTARWKSTPVSPGRKIEFLTCPTTRFCVALATVKGQAPLRIFTSVNPTGGPRAWTVASRRLFVGGISCPSTKLCVVVGVGEITTSTNPSVGSRSVWKVTARWPQLSSTEMTGVSCVSATFCVAVDDAGDVFTSKNPTGGKSAWKITTVDATAALEGVTCPSASFCASFDTMGRLTFSTNPTGGVSAWHRVSAPPSSARLTCASATFCAAVANPAGGTGEVLTTTNPTGGSGAWQVSTSDAGRQVSRVACASPHLCVAGDVRGNVLSSPNPGGGPSTWTTRNVTGVSGIMSVECPAAALCVAGDDAGNIITSTKPGGGAAAWHQAHIEGPFSNGALTKIDDVSCPGTGLCVAVDSQGNVFWATNPMGGRSAWSKANVDGTTKINSAVCATKSLCVAGDAAGNILSSVNPTGGASAWHVASVSTADDALYVTCPTASLCLASGEQAIFVSTNPAGGPSAWHLSAHFVNANGIGPITCPTTSLCVAVGLNRFSPGADPSPAIFSTRHPAEGIADWNLISPTPGSGSQDDPGGAIACPSARFCLAQFGPDSEVFASSDPASSNATAWRNAGVSAAAVSCSSRSLCVAGNDLGRVQVGTPPAPTSTVLKLSARRIAYGREQGERLTVTVRTRLTGVPAGTVVVSSKTRTICTLRRLTHGTASCTLTRKQLRPGSYRLIARYSGNSAFLGSKSAAEVLTVFRPR